MKRYFLIIFLFFAIFNLVEAKQVLRFAALVKQYDENVLPQQRIKFYQHFTAALSKQSGLAIKFVPFASYNKMNTAFHQGHLDFIYVESGEYARSVIKHQPGYPIGTVLVKHHNHLVDHYASYIVSVNPKLKTLTALKHHTFAFNGSYLSASGYIYPAAYFITQMHTTLSHFFSHIYLAQSSLGAMRMLAKGQADAISVWDDSFHINRQARFHYNFIHVIHNIPNPPFVANQNVTRKQRNALTVALTKLPASAFNGLSFSGVEATKNGFYDECIKHLRLLLHVDEKAMQGIQTLK